MKVRTSSMIPMLLDHAIFFTDTVNMNTLTGKVIPLFEKVIHVAFGCGCVQTFHVEHQVVMNRCPCHGDGPISSTEELVPRSQAA